MTVRHGVVAVAAASPTRPAAPAFAKAGGWRDRVDGALHNP
jgi:hypothetical protein